MPVLGCGAEMAKLMDVSDSDVALIEDVIAERLAVGVSQPLAQRQAVDEALAQLAEERSMVMKAVMEQLGVKEAEPVMANKPAFSEDIPNESWLQGKVDYALRSPRNEFGVPKMSSVTGYFDSPVMFPARWASELKGQRGEQDNVRKDDLAAIRKILKDTGKMPLTDNGKEYVPYIEIGYNGKPWVSEGNHRIMAAVAEGWDYIPAEVRYFDGGQRHAGKWAPDNLIEITERESGETPVFSNKADQTETPEFKRWFGDSKVVDAEGKPLVVYHGTDADFYTFRTKSWEGGAFFSTNKDGAAEYGNKLLSVYLSIKNPLEVSARNWISGSVLNDEAAKEAGYDGYVIKDHDIGSESDNPLTGDTYVAFSPNQIKSATGNNGQFDPTNPDIRFSNKKSALGFYSALSTAIDGINAKAQPADGWKAQIKGLIAKGAVKADEVEWTGLNDWLDLQTGKVTKEAVQAYLDGNGVRVEEVTLKDPRYDEWIPEDSTEEYGQEEPMPAKYGQYTLPGGENYREVLLTLPVTERNAAGMAEADRLRDEAMVLDKQAMAAWTQRGDMEEFTRLNDQARELRQRASAAEKAGGTESFKFLSSHWDQPNVLAHIRLNDRTDADGKRVLFVEEIQSDWGQLGKKDGFAGGAKDQAKFEALRAEYDTATPQRRGEISDEMNAIADAKRDGVPAAPFVTKTEGWLNLALKRIMVMAAEGGYEKIAFISGEQSADRYKLSKQVESVSWSTVQPDNSKIIGLFPKGEAPIQLSVGVDGMVEEARGAARLEGKMLDEVIGKDFAQRVMEEKEGYVSGAGLDVGGEGMKAFYDSIVPKATNELLRKLKTGAKLGGVTINGASNGFDYYADGDTFVVVDGKDNFVTRFDTSEMAAREVDRLNAKESNTQPGFDVTDAMRERVDEGMPLFSNKRAVTETPEFKRWFGDSKVVDAEGKPLVVYHTTAADFSEFDTTRRAIGGEGSWFSNTPTKGNGDDGERVMPVYLSLQNPKIIGERDPSDVLKKRFIEQGHDGVVMMRGGKIITAVAFRPEQIKSAIGNNGQFDPENPDIRFANKPSGLRWRDETGRLQFAPGEWLWRKSADTWAGTALRLVGMKAMSPELKRQMRQMTHKVEQAKETAAAVARETIKLSQAEREMVSDLVEKTVKAGTVPPAHGVKLAAMINQTMEQQTNKLVALGMLSQEAADRWRGVYLPRYYAPKLKSLTNLDQWGEALKNLTRRASLMRGIKGKHLKSRGLFENIHPGDLPNYEALGWEVRDPDYKPGVSTEVQVWRDYTPQERENMGEIRDAGFRFIMGYMQTQKDIALGEMFQNMANDPALSSRLPTKTNTVLVPDTKVAETGVKVYGALAGRYVSKETLSHLTSFDEAQSDMLRMYRKAMSIWKEGKTVLNPVSHLNNTISNMTMAHLAGVSYHRGDKYLGAVSDFITGKGYIQEGKEAGLFQGNFTEAELAESLPKELRELARMQEGLGVKVGRTAFNVMTMWLRKPMTQAYQFEDSFFKYLLYKDARQRGLDPQSAIDYAQRYIFTYDDLPKNARHLRDFGMPFFAYTYKAVPALLHTALTHPLRLAMPAGLLWGATAATYAALAGEDDEDWMEKLKRAALDAERRKKIGELIDFDQKHLPPWMRGETAFLTPKAMRVGFDQTLDMPVFLDVSRFIPGGDLFDINANAGGVPLPQPLTPGHPILGMAMSMIGNRDLFTGKDIVDKNDTSGEAAEKRFAWVWKSLTPAIVFGNYHWDRALDMMANAAGGELTYAPEIISERYTGVGRDGLPVQPKYGIPQTFGVKVRPIDQDKAEEIEGALDKKMLREIDAEIRQLNRLNDAGFLSDKRLEKLVGLQEIKKDRIKEGLTVDGNEKD